MSSGGSDNGSTGGNGVINMSEVAEPVAVSVPIPELAPVASVVAPAPSSDNFGDMFAFEAPATQAPPSQGSDNFGDIFGSSQPTAAVNLEVPSDSLI
jgi:hypothetical protein